MKSYKITDIDVIEGDTIEATIHLGLGISVRKEIRFKGMDGWCTRGPNRTLGNEAEGLLRDVIDSYVSHSVEIDSDSVIGRLKGVVYGNNRYKKNLNKILAKCYSDNKEII